jgi:hypothetical protein
MFLMATEDLKHLARRRIIDRDGYCSPWPMETSIGTDGYSRTEPANVVGMRHVDGAKQLKHFWLEGAAQEWADLLGWPMPTDEAFFKTLKTHAPQ